MSFMHSKFQFGFCVETNVSCQVACTLRIKKFITECVECVSFVYAFWVLWLIAIWRFCFVDNFHEVPEILCVSSDPSLCSSVGDSPVHGFAPQLSQRFPVWRAVSGHVFAPASTECTLYSIPKYDGCQKECGPFSLFSQENDTWDCSMGL